MTQRVFSLTFWRCQNKRKSFPFMSVRPFDKDRPTPPTSSAASVSWIKTAAVSSVSPLYGDHFVNDSLRHAPEHLADLDGRGCHFDECEVRTMAYVQLLGEKGMAARSILPERRNTLARGNRRHAC
jgi:hypothetical protein